MSSNRIDGNNHIVTKCDHHQVSFVGIVNSVAAICMFETKLCLLGCLICVSLSVNNNIIYKNIIILLHPSVVIHLCVVVYFTIVSWNEHFRSFIVVIIFCHDLVQVRHSVLSTVDCGF